MAWSDLSMRERNAYILTAIKNGIYDRLQIIDAYNKFGNGGYKEDVSWDGTLDGSLSGSILLR